MLHVVYAVRVREFLFWVGCLFRLLPSSEPFLALSLAHTHPSLFGKEFRGGKVRRPGLRVQGFPVRLVDLLHRPCVGTRDSASCLTHFPLFACDWFSKRHY